jgi:hypothetical protein
MESATEFIFGPLPPIEEPAPSVADEQPATFAAEPANPLGPLAGLVGTWTGEGFNVIWRPSHPPRGQFDQDHFLELNRTKEHLEFSVLRGQIPNRGLLQPDIPLHGLNYLQQIFDANLLDAQGNPKGQHFEPGLWLLVPKTSHPGEPRRTVARLACIPHGTTILAQGTFEHLTGPPTFPKVDISPFPIGFPTDKNGQLEQTLTAPSRFRTSGPGLGGITQQMVDNPNSVLIMPTTAGTTTTRLHVATRGSLPGGGKLPGGGASNIAFLKGGPGGPNAVTTHVTATFWLVNLGGDSNPRLQYSQTVLLDFNGISWPHVTVATLERNEAPPPAPS